MHRVFTVTWFVVGWFVVGCATAGVSAARTPAATQPFTPERYNSLASVTDARISPDGVWVAYALSVPRMDEKAQAPGAVRPGDECDNEVAVAEARKPRREIWLVPTAGGNARRFVSPAWNAWDPRWSSDSSRIAFLSRRPDHHCKPQVYVIAVAAGEARPITSLAEGIETLEWSPDGAAIAVTSPEPQPEERKTGRDWNQAGQPRGHHRLWLVHVNESRPPRKLVDDRHVWGMAWAPAGDRILIRASDMPDADSDLMHTELFVVDVAAAAVTQVTRRAPAKLGGDRGMAWSPDGTRIAFLAGVDATDPRAGSIFVAPAAGGKAVNLTGDYRGTVEWMDWRDDRTVAFAAVSGPATVLATMPAAGGAPTIVRDATAAGSKTDPVMCYQPRLAGDRTTFACLGDSRRHPREVYVGSMAARGSGLRRLTVSNPGLDQVRFANQRVIEWKAKDGMVIDGIVIEPIGYRSGTRYPLVVLPHGGPEGSRENGWLGYPGQLLAARGFMVLYPNYRGSAGRGVRFAKADHRDMAGAEFDDVLAGIDYLAALGLIDEKRVGMGGWSYGGYFSAWAATRHSQRFAAAVMGAGIANWISYQGTSDIPEEMAGVHWALDPYEHMDLVWDRSPLAHAANARTPTLILHGERDERVPPGQAWEMYRALVRAGVDTELVTYPREPHGIREEAHRADMVARFLAWFERYLKPGT